MSRSRTHTLPVAVLLAAVGALTLPSAAAADERACRGSIGATTVDDLRVPTGAKCVLTRTKVEGNIEVKRNAVLRARNVRVDGNVQGENSKRVNVVGRSRVNGDVQVFAGGPVKVRRSTIGGNIQLDENRGDQRVVGNAVDGDVQLFQNRIGVKRVKGNRIGGNLQCKQNRPAPVGGNNVVGGNKENQCARL